ncbi:MAG: hypothetical protein ACI9YH_003729, partial [Colwellia sp.]
TQCDQGTGDLKQPTDIKCFYILICRIVHVTNVYAGTIL